MDIQFFGAAGEVTGSKHLLTLQNGQRILLDCGLFQGGETEEETYFRNEHLGFDPKTIDCLILSHAHIDHSGLIPKLVKEGFTGLIYATPQTKDLCQVMLEDSAQIQQMDTETLNKERLAAGKKAVRPLYKKSDVRKTLEYFIDVPYGREIEVLDGVSFHFTDTGHILGSAAVHLNIQEDPHEAEAPIKLSFTGDVGRPGDKILRSPEPFRQADVVLTESTYGIKSHDPPDSLDQKLADAVWETGHEQRGKLLIPAFSLDRTQDLVYILHNLYREGRLPNVKIFVDSPLANKVTAIMRENTSAFNQRMLKAMRRYPQPFQFEMLYYTEGKSDSKALNHIQEPAVIISSSGMMEGGRIVHHLIHQIEDPQNTILIVGFSAPGTLGRTITDGAEEVNLFGKTYQVRARVKAIDGFSAHADAEELVDYLSCQDPEELAQIFLVHGEQEALSHMKARLHQAGYTNIMIPQQHEQYHLAKHYGKLVMTPMDTKASTAS